MKLNFNSKNHWALSKIDDPSKLKERFLENSRFFLNEQSRFKDKGLCQYLIGDIQYDDINSFGFRCDEFDEIGSADKLFIFVGCSITYGLAIRKEDTWAYKMHQEFLKQYPGQKIPFINLSFPGSGVDFALRNLRNFIRHFNLKKVDGIFGMNINVRRFEILAEDQMFLCSPPVDERRYWSAAEEHLIKQMSNLVANDWFIQQRMSELLNGLKDLASSVDCCDLGFTFLLTQTDDITLMIKVISDSQFDFCLVKNYKDVEIDFGDDLVHFGPASQDVIFQKVKKRFCTRSSVGRAPD